ncbi:MAG: MerC domain-containing protein [Pseudomonadota bacterium]
MSQPLLQTSTAGALSRSIDLGAAGLSGLCVLHCLALPVLAAFLPLAGTVSEMEWVHKALVLMAAPLSLYAVLGKRPHFFGPVFIMLATAGLSLLTLAAFAEPLHDYETPLTVIGAVLLASAHLRRFWQHTVAKR